MLLEGASGVGARTNEGTQRTKFPLDERSCGYDAQSVERAGSETDSKLKLGQVNSYEGNSRLPQVM